MKAKYLASFCIAAIVLTFIFSALGLMCGVAVNAFAFPAAIVAAGGLCLTPICGKLNFRDWSIAVATGLCAIVLFAGCAMLIDDFSFDGNFYHQEAMALLMQGWNPYDLTQLTDDHSLWANHYAIGMEITETAISLTFGRDIEAGKALNLIITLAAFAMVYGEVAKNQKRLMSCLIAVAVTGCPVLASQIFTYLDWALYAFLLILLIAIWQMGRGHYRAYALIAVLIVLYSVATKFNVFFYSCLMLAVAFVWHLVCRNPRAAWRLFYIGCFGVVAGLLLSYHPYLHNCIIGGHPFYPLMGEGAEDIMTGHTPDIYTGNRVVDFFISVCAITRPAVDVRSGGFGPVMILMLIISAWMLMPTLYKVGVGHVAGDIVMFRLSANLVGQIHSAIMAGALFGVGVCIPPWPISSYACGAPLHDAFHGGHFRILRAI